jgi:hypothetical protein
MIARASIPILRSMMDDACSRKWEPAVLGVHASTDWAERREFTHKDVPVRVQPCVSALAVREAVLGHRPGEWTVILTDRTDEDLGPGLLSHLISCRLRTPDPWQGVRERFAATGIDPVLTRRPGDRDIAVGLLAATPPGGWQPAPGGVVTRDHACGAIAAVHLGLTDPVIDIAAVLAWTAGPALATRVADLRRLVSDPLADAVLDWVADRSGAIGRAIRHLLRGGEAHDAVPLGLIAGLLGQARDSKPARLVTGVGQVSGASQTTGSSTNRAQIAREALIRLEARLGGTVPGTDALRTWAAEAATAIEVMERAAVTRGDTGYRREIERPSQKDAGQLLARADQLLAAVQAEALADDSDLLPSGLTRRLAALAERLRAATAPAAVRFRDDNSADVDGPLISAEALRQVEAAWTDVAAHRLAEVHDDVPACRAAVRLVRWLATDSATGESAVGALPALSLPTLARRHGEHDAWADSAINDAAPGVTDRELGSGLAAVLSIAGTRRAAHDRAFAVALAAYTRDDPGRARHGYWQIEDLLPDTVLPLARKTPVLLLVLDGMSAGVGAEVVASVVARSRSDWAEALLPGQPRRAAALAALPTITRVSRASLFTGRLTVGGQDVERAGFKALTHDHGVPGALLFHKRPLDSSKPGYALADDVAGVIEDTRRHPLVACVLNTIDDALDRSDPESIAWGAETVKHLRPLLDGAKNAGRVVILTADHGHVIERRQGTQRTYPDTSSSRSRSAVPPAGEGEIVVSGPRVLLHDETAVLAVDQDLRYGPLKAGYHGGGTPAEAIVPVAVLVPGAVPRNSDDDDDSGLVLAPPQEPAWWLDPEPGPAAETPPLPSALAAPTTERPGRSQEIATVPSKRPDETMATLFDEIDVAPQLPIPDIVPPRSASAAKPAAPATAAAELSVPARVIKSKAYAAQKKIAGRISVTDEHVATLLSALLAAPGRRLTPAAAAASLQVAPVLLRGAVLQVQKLLNIEGYAVLRVDADGATLILDDTLLLEQYGIVT